VSLNPKYVNPVTINKLIVTSIQAIKVGPTKKDNPITIPSPIRAPTKVPIKSIGYLKYFIYKH
jgi:hypothetical protein